MPRMFGREVSASELNSRPGSDEKKNEAPSDELSEASTDVEAEAGTRDLNLPELELQLTNAGAAHHAKSKKGTAENILYKLKHLTVESRSSVWGVAYDLTRKKGLSAVKTVKIIKTVYSVHMARSTLSRALSNGWTGVPAWGRQRYLPPALEEAVVDWIRACRQCKMPVYKHHVIG